jgi:hypothetical protein
VKTIASIVTLLGSSPIAAKILTHIASRQRNRRAESVRRLMQVCGNQASRQAVIAVLRQLEANDFGVLIVGRKGHESRFVWSEV